jgi:hypothetical protein
VARQVHFGGRSDRNMACSGPGMSVSWSRILEIMYVNSGLRPLDIDLLMKLRTLANGTGCLLWHSPGILHQVYLRVQELKLISWQCYPASTSYSTHPLTGRWLQLSYSCLCIHASAPAVPWTTFELMHVGLPTLVPWRFKTPGRQPICRHCNRCNSINSEPKIRATKG